MRKTILYVVLLILQNQIVTAQNIYTISGHVFDTTNGEYLVGATIYNLSTKNGTTTNEYGFYSIDVPEGKSNFKCSYIGYGSKQISVSIQKDSILNFELNSQSINLNEVQIRETAKNNLKINEFGFERISAKSIRQLPSIIGEPDLIKALQLQSGVKTIGDGSSGMFIRGGNSDQNLIIIDEAPIYNPSHLFGLISIFNTDVLGNMKFYKSNMPAQYGGRASAVIDCKMKEGNLKHKQLSVGISPFSANLSLNGPIIKDKASYLFSIRKSYIDLFMNAGANMTLLPAFYDLNAKTNIKLGEKNRLYFSIYHGLDKLQSADGFYNKWANKTATLRLNNILNSKLFSNLSLIYSNYDNYLEFVEEKRNYKWLTGVKDLNAKIDFSWYLKPETLIKFGGGTIYHRFVPGETNDSTLSIPRIQSYETSAYILNDITPFEWLGINYGIRFSVFQNVGTSKIFNYNEEHEYESTSYNQIGIYNTYWNLEPRLNFNFKIAKTSSIKLAYARNAQYMQVLQNNSLSYSSLETWFPANKNIEPLLADILSLGFFQNMSANFSASIETYYKAFKNQIDYIDHAALINNPYIESQTLSGNAKAYGIELILKKESGNLTGSFSYNYSKSSRTINGINNGVEYNSPYDIPHDIKIVGNYSLNNNWNLNSAWVFQTGRPVTLPVSFYFYQGDAVPIYTKRNDSRFPNYHRLDISCTYQTKRVDRPNWFLTFGIYNLYSRRNPLGYKLVYDYSTNSMKGYEYALFTFFPSISIRFEI